MAMRRLLSLLRQTQAYCTDTECIDERMLPGSSNQTPADSFLMMSLFIVFALAMYFMRPRTLRNYSDADAKPFGGGAGGTGAPPTPPPATS
ncbi:uncharacterized protein CBL_00735 [Carabus blaptoides fortunei]